MTQEQRSKAQIRLFARLRLGQVEQALALLRRLIGGASYSDLIELIGTCPPGLRDHLICMLSDVLAGYPAPLWGFPFLLQITPYPGDFCKVELPLADHPPSTDIRSLAWLGELDLGRPGHFLPYVKVPATVAVGKLQPVVLLARTKDGEPPDPPSDEWIAEAFMQICDRVETVEMSPTQALLWPSAVEAACAMRDGANGVSPEYSPCFFSGLQVAVWAHQVGERFAAGLADQWR